jgi:1,2-diacylglycerol 3-beta-galactosyltransferase
MPEGKRILILFSDTGGGHRSAAESIAEAFGAEYGNAYTPILVDALKDFTPRPIRSLPQIYPDLVRIPRAWGLGYRLLDGHRRSAALSRAVWGFAKRRSKDLVEEYQPDLVISVHPLLHRSMMGGHRNGRLPFVTVVTDMVSAHSLWYQSGCDLCLVATKSVRERAVASGLQPDQVRVVGMPVSLRHANMDRDCLAIRSELGWPLDQPVVLLIGGGEGMGPLYETVQAIDELPKSLTIAVVTGRNHALRSKIEATDWSAPVYTYGFENRLPEMMRAATLLVTKAGPGTIAEAVNAGLPLVLYDHLPGQEDGNVTYVVQNGVGEWAPGPRRAAAAVAGYLTRPERIRNASRNCQRIARPDAALQIVRNVDSLLGERAQNAVSHLSAPSIE